MIDISQVPQAPSLNPNLLPPPFLQNKPVFYFYFPSITYSLKGDSSVFISSKLCPPLVCPPLVTTHVCPFFSHSPTLSLLHWDDCLLTGALAPAVLPSFTVSQVIFLKHKSDLLGSCLNTVNTPSTYQIKSSQCHMAFPD